MSGSANILVIDGDPSARTLIRLVLQNAYPEANVEEIDAAVPFAESWSKGPWQAALYDPGTSAWAEGPRLVTALKRNDPGLRVIVVSEGLGGDAVADLFRAGADDVMGKSADVLVELPRRLEVSLVPSSSRPESELGEPTVETYIDEHELLKTELPGAGTEVAPRPSRPPGASGASGSAPLRPGGPDPAAMVHDLKQPLRTIHTMLERCDRRHRDALPSEARSLMQWAQRSALQLSSDLDELQAELTGAQGGAPVESDASQALSDALSNLQALAEDTDASVSTATLPRVRVPLSAVRRILENLLANAMRHRGNNHPEIHVAARVLDTEAVFSVKDNGPGIPEALQHRVFEPGVRGETGGAGLGLYSARRLVERWGGQIWFDTVPGEGTTFFFRLPIAAQRAARRSKN
jgi:CheY-like chemotaxis protein